MNFCRRFLPCFSLSFLVYGMNGGNNVYPLGLLGELDKVITFNMELVYGIKTTVCFVAWYILRT